jgi:hypothetical protein
MSIWARKLHPGGVFYACRRVHVKADTNCLLPRNSDRIGLQTFGDFEILRLSGWSLFEALLS